MTMQPDLTRRLLLCVGAAPLLGRAQAPAAVRKVGVLSLEGPNTSTSQSMQRVMRETLRRMGFTEGGNVAFDWRFADGKVARLKELADELSRAKVDVIVAAFGSAIAAAGAATKSVPVVMLGGFAPVEQGLARDLARPGGNVTGTLWGTPDQVAKLVDLIKEAAPAVDHIAVVAPANLPARAQYRAALDRAAVARGIVLKHHQPAKPEDVAAIWRRPEPKKPPVNNPDALLVLGDAAMDPLLAAINAFAAQRKLLTATTSPVHVRNGAIALYQGPAYADVVERTALFVHKLLSGSKPADLAIEPPRKLELFVSKKALAALAMKLPDALHARARLID